eukprot:1389328-Amorphochlora_amoeboformis.AAC.2
MRQFVPVAAFAAFLLLLAISLVSIPRPGSSEILHQSFARAFARASIPSRLRDIPQAPRCFDFSGREMAFGWYGAGRAHVCSEILRSNVNVAGS